MLNVEDARKAAQEVWEYTSDKPKERIQAYANLINFFDEVERLLHYNAIKQTPALFKVVK